MHKISIIEFEEGHFEYAELMLNRLLPKFVWIINWSNHPKLIYKTLGVLCNLTACDVLCTESFKNFAEKFGLFECIFSN